MTQPLVVNQGDVIDLCMDSFHKGGAAALEAAANGLRDIGYPDAALFVRELAAGIAATTDDAA